MFGNYNTNYYLHSHNNKCLQAHHTRGAPRKEVEYFYPTSECNSGGGTGCLPTEDYDDDGTWIGDDNNTVVGSPIESADSISSIGQDRSHTTSSLNTSHFSNDWNFGLSDSDNESEDSESLQPHDDNHAKRPRYVQAVEERPRFGQAEERPRYVQAEERPRFVQAVEERPRFGQAEERPGYATSYCHKCSPIEAHLL
jgi:hypothetical protein